MATKLLDAARCAGPAAVRLLQMEHMRLMISV
jgi:hypothetical protein